MNLNCGMALPLAREFARKGIRVIPNPNLFDQSTPYPARTILAGDVESAKSPITTDRRKNLIPIHSVDALHQHNRFYQSHKIPDKKDVRLEKSLRPIRMVFDL